MALFNDYGPRNFKCTVDLDTSWYRELVKNEWHEVAGTEGGYHIWYWKYHRTRTKTFKYFGMTREAALICAAAMHAKFNRKILPQFLNVEFQPARIFWDRLDHPLQQDYNYKDCAKISQTLVAGDDWSVEVQVDEELTYNHDPRVYDPEDVKPTIWTEFEIDPTSSSFDSYFTGIAGTLDYLG